MSDGEAVEAAGDATAGGEESLVTGRDGRLLLGLSVGWGLLQAGRLALSPLLPTIIDAFGVSTFVAGLSLSLLWGLYALCQYPSGRLSDRLSRTTLVVGGLALAVAGFGILALAPVFPVFLAGVAVVGVGAGLYPTAARALVSDLYVDRRGAAYGLHTASGDLGGGVAAGLAVAALAVGVWQAAFVPVAVGLAGVAAALHRFSPEPYEFGRPSLAVRSTADRLLGSTRTVGLLAAYVLYAFVWQGAAGFLPTFLQKVKGFSPAVAGGGFAALFLVGAVVKPAAGSLGDRVPRRLVAVGGLWLGGAALAGVVVADGTAAVGLAVVAFAAGQMAVPPALQAHLMDVFPDGSMGGDLGAMRTVYIGLGSLGPAYVGYVAGRAAAPAGYRTAFWGLVACLLASGAVLLALWVLE